MSTTPDLSGLEWVKSSYSEGNGGNCVEWAPIQAAATASVPVRDSKDPGGPALVFSVEAFADFVGAIKSGQFAV